MLGKGYNKCIPWKEIKQTGGAIYLDEKTGAKIKGKKTSLPVPVHDGELIYFSNSCRGAFHKRFDLAKERRCTSCGRTADVHRGYMSP